jgi:hypothetical protein
MDKNASTGAYTDHGSPNEPSFGQDESLVLSNVRYTNINHHVVIPTNGTAIRRNSTHEILKLDIPHVCVLLNFPTPINSGRRTLPIEFVLDINPIRGGMWNNAKIRFHFLRKFDDALVFCQGGQCRPHSGR